MPIEQVSQGLAIGDRRWAPLGEVGRGGLG
jgi:hypothetical protein